MLHTNHRNQPNGSNHSGTNIYIGATFSNNNKDCHGKHNQRQRTIA
jgi:hypothetical protein